METRVPAIHRAMRKTPRQRRSQAMVEVILEAAARVLAQTGWAKFTTNEVARIAGISVGSLYQYFPNKLALAEAIRKQHLDAVLEALDGSNATSLFGAISLQARVSSLINGIIAAHIVNPDLHRVLLDEVPLSGRSEQVEFERRYQENYRLIVAQAFGDSSPRIPVAAKVLASAVEGVVHDASRRGELSLPELQRELGMLVTAFLGGFSVHAV